MAEDVSRRDEASDPAGPQHRRAGAGGGLALNLLLAGITMLVTLLVLELAIRIHHGRLLDFSSQLTPLPNRSETPAAVYDDQLGWVPKPGIHEPLADEKWSVNEAGLRNNGGTTPAQGRPVVVVGDSFAFGDEVGDAETFPARLEALLGVPVLNGGVFAYGIDQAYLRALRMIDQYDPGLVVLAFISNDISRAEASFYWGWKPYFEYVGDEITLRNVPVPAGYEPEPRFATLRTALSYSFLCSALLRRVAPRWWSYGMIVRVHSDGERLAIDFFELLREKAESRNATFLVLALGTNGRIGGNGRSVRIVEEARSRGIDVIDFVPEIEAMTPEAKAPLFMPRGHYSPEMNGRVAARVVDFLERHRQDMQDDARY